MNTNDKKSSLYCRSLSISNTDWSSIEDLKKIDDHLASCKRRHLPLKDILLNSPFPGSTPLLQATKSGKLDAVEHMLKVWCVDVNQRGVYHWGRQKANNDIYLDATSLLLRLEGLEQGAENGTKYVQRRKDRKKLIFHNATPLFVAASMGHYHLIRIFVEEMRADLEMMAFRRKENGHKEHMTPLQAAVIFKCTWPLDRDSMWQKQILKYLVSQRANISRPFNGVPMWAMVTRWLPEEGVALTKFLIELGMDVHQVVPVSGVTSLHLWAISPPYPHCTRQPDSFDVVKLLLQKGLRVNQGDRYGISPVTGAALCDPPHMHALELFLDERQTYLTKQQKIDALELGGSSFMLRFFYTGKNQDRLNGLKYWETAMSIRDEATPKIVQVLTERAKLALNIEREWNSIEEIKAYWQSTYKLATHAFLTRYRILGDLKAGPSASTMISGWDSFFVFLERSGSVLLEENPPRAIQFNEFILFEVLRFHEHFEIERSGRLYEKYISLKYKSFQELVHVMVKINFPQKRQQYLTFDRLINILMVASQVSELNLDFKTRDRVTQDNLLVLISWLMKECREDKEKTFKMESLLYQVVQHQEKDKNRGLTGNSLLQVLIRKPTRPVPNAPVLTDTGFPPFTASLKHDMIRLLVKLKADVDVTTANGNTLLTLLAYHDFDVVAAHILIELGVHFDQPNKRGKSVKEILKQGPHAQWKKLKEVPSLRCQAARVVRIKRIPFEAPGEIPSTLKEFTLKH